MGLFAPWFLAGVVAVGLPIYLHLLRRHSTTPRPFSSLMFFEPRTQSSIKHRRLRYLLLLSLRMALLVLLALAFANPFIMRPTARTPGGRLVLLAIDDSFSMHAGPRMHDAKRETPNWTVESVTAPGQLWGSPRDAKPTRVQAIITGYATPAATRTASLLVNGKTTATKTVQVPAGGRATVEFPSLDVPFGFSRC